MNPVSRSLITIEQVVWGEYTRAMPLAIPLRSMVLTTSSVTSTNSMQREVVKVWFSNSIFMCPTRLRRGEGPLAVRPSSPNLQLQGMTTQSHFLDTEDSYPGRRWMSKRESAGGGAKAPGPRNGNVVGRH